MPVPPPLPVCTLSPKRTMTSARPSPLESNRPTRNPPAGGGRCTKLPAPQLCAFTPRSAASRRGRALPSMLLSLVGRVPLYANGHVADDVAHEGLWLSLISGFLCLPRISSPSSMVPTTTPRRTLLGSFLFGKNAKRPGQRP